jgi:cell shape-determining protein MreD
LRQVPLLFSFSLALLFTLSGTALIPHVRLLPFSPFLALLYNKTSFVKALWLASLCGLIVDLLCSELRLGVYALNYCGTTLLLYKQKRHFYEDKAVALSLFTALISILSTLLQFFLISIFGQSLTLSPKLLLTDLAIMPLADAAYAYLWFTCPMFLYAYIKKVGWRNTCSKILFLFSKKEKEE